MIIAESTFEDVKKYLEKRQDIIIPFGSIEAHGPHLPLFCDTYAIKAIVRQVEKETKIAVAPTLFYTPARLLEYLPGTVSLDFEPTKNYFKNIFLSFAQMGFQKFWLVTYHGNRTHIMAILEAVYEIKKERQDIFFEAINIWERIKALGQKQGILETEEIHAGEIETSLMFYLKPNLVKKEKLISEPIEKDEALLLSQFKKTKHGVFGNARLASVKKGEKLFSLAVKEILRIIKT